MGMMKVFLKISTVLALCFLLTATTAHDWVPSGPIDYEGNWYTFWKKSGVRLRDFEKGMPVKIRGAHPDVDELEGTWVSHDRSNVVVSMCARSGVVGEFSFLLQNIR